MRLTRLVPTRILGGSGFAAVGKRVFPRADLALQRMSRGRISLTTAAGLPLLLLETTGRRTGEARVTPLTYAKQGEDFLVAGSNWGQERHPGWVLNLLAKPEAVVELHGERIPVTARRLRDAERAAAWALLLEVWPAYDEYVRRIRQSSDRELMVFRLVSLTGTLEIQSPAVSAVSSRRRESSRAASTGISSSRQSGESAI